ncbi:MAG: hypothetical protein H6909_02475 [Rickettsiaceae bacterium]|nr:hypothetical protein [Rickettsiaceae bacterium]
MKNKSKYNIISIAPVSLVVHKGATFTEKAIQSFYEKRDLKEFAYNLECARKNGENVNAICRQTGETLSTILLKFPDFRFINKAEEIYSDIDWFNAHNNKGETGESIQHCLKNSTDARAERYNKHFKEFFNTKLQASEEKPTILTKTVETNKDSIVANNKEVSTTPTTGKEIAAPEVIIDPVTEYENNVVAIYRIRADHDNSNKAGNVFLAASAKNLHLTSIPIAPVSLVVHKSATFTEKAIQSFYEKRDLKEFAYNLECARKNGENVNAICRQTGETLSTMLLKFPDFRFINKAEEIYSDIDWFNAHNNKGETGESIQHCLKNSTDARAERYNKHFKEFFNTKLLEQMLAKKTDKTEQDIIVARKIAADKITADKKVPTTDKEIATTKVIINPVTEEAKEVAANDDKKAENVVPTATAENIQSVTTEVITNSVNDLNETDLSGQDVSNDGYELYNTFAS